MVCAASVIGLLQHRPPTVGPRNRGCPQGFGENSLVKTFPLNRRGSGPRVGVGSWFVAGAPRTWTSDRVAAACRRAGSRYGRPWGASLLDQRDLPVVEVRAQRATRPALGADVGSWFVAGAPRTSTSDRVAAACWRAGSRYGRPWGASLLDQRDLPVVEVRAQRATRPALGADVGSGFVAGAPRTSTSDRVAAACWVPGLATVGPGGPPYSTSETSRWLTGERSGPRNHQHLALDHRGGAAQRWPPPGKVRPTPRSSE